MNTHTINLHVFLHKRNVVSLTEIILLSTVILHIFSLIKLNRRIYNESMYMVVDVSLRWENRCKKFCGRIFRRKM